MAVIKYNLFSFFDCMYIFEDEGSVLNGIKSKNVNYNNRLFVYPSVRLPVRNIMNHNSFLSGYVFRESQFVSLILLCDEMPYSSKRFLSSRKGEAIISVRGMLIGFEKFVLFAGYRWLLVSLVLLKKTSLCTGSYHKWCVLMKSIPIMSSVTCWRTLTGCLIRLPNTSKSISNTPMHPNDFPPAS